MKHKVRQELLCIKDELANEAEQEAFRSEMSVVYKITKPICGNKNDQSAPVGYRNGYALTAKRKQATIWIQHLQEVLNRPESDEAANPPPAEDVTEIKTNPPNEAEVKGAIKAMKSGKASGIDSIHAEMLNAKILTDLFTTIWTKDNIPTDGTKGLIVKLPKKEDLQICNN